jgi:hypothetical protein
MTMLSWTDHVARRTLQWTPFAQHQLAWRWTEPAHLSRTDLPDRSGSITAGSTCRCALPWRSVDPPLEAAIKAGKAPRSTLQQLHPMPGANLFILALFETGATSEKWAAAVELDGERRHPYGLLPVKCAAVSDLS